MEEREEEGTPGGGIEETKTDEPLVEGDGGGDGDNDDNEDSDPKDPEELVEPDDNAPMEEHFAYMTKKALQEPRQEDAETMLFYIDNLKVMNHVTMDILALGTFPPRPDNPDVLHRMWDAGIRDVHSFITMQEEDFESIGVKGGMFGIVRKLKALNYWYNKCREETENESEFDIFSSMDAIKLQRVMTTAWKPVSSELRSQRASLATVPEEQDDDTKQAAHVPAGIGSNAAKIKELRRSSGLLASGLKSRKKSVARVTFNTPAPAPASNPPNTPNPMNPPTLQPSQYGLAQPAWTWPTSSRAADFDKGGRRSVQDYTTFSNKEQWPKWSRQLIGQVETATYGSEFMVARQAVERIIDLRYTLRSFGVPLDGEAWLFGDNKSVVTSSTIPHSSLGKRWNALSYHKVREAVAGGWLRFEHIAGTENPADILTKPLAWHMMRVFVEPLLMWKGDTLDAPSGSPNPEGSNAAETPITSPSPGLPESNPGNPRGVSTDPGTNANSGQSSIVRAGNPGAHVVSGVLWNNQYAALADEEDNALTALSP
jgi:hypothetical protein